MALVLVVAVLGLGAGLIAGGRLSQLAGLPVRLGSALPVGLAVQVVSLLLEPWSRVLAAAGYAAAAGFVAAFTFANLRLPGVPLMGVGLLLNALVVLANGLAMPVSLTAAHRAGIATEDLHLDADPLHRAAGAGTHLDLLGDVIAVPLPARPQVVSAGDVLLASGVGLFLCMGSLRDPREDEPPQPDDVQPPNGRTGENQSRQPRDGQPPSRDARSTTRVSDSTTRGSYS